MNQLRSRQFGTLIAWGFIYMVLWLSVYTPFFILTFALMMIPAICMYVDLGRRRFWIAVIGSLLVLTILGPYVWPLWLVAIFFTLPAVAMGEGYIRQHAAKTVVTWGILALLAQQLIMFILVYLIYPDMTNRIRNFLHESVETLPPIFMNELPADYIDLLIAMMIKMVPFGMIAFAFSYAAFSHFVSRHVLAFRKKPVSALPPLHTWMLPRSLVWYYLVTLFLDFFFNNNPDSFLTTILWNLLPLLMYAFSIQALSFLSYVAMVKKWPKWLPIFAVFLIPFFPQVLSLLGVLDLIFPIRKSLKTK